MNYNINKFEEKSDYMAIFECKYRLGLTDVGKSNLMTNKAILKVLENAGGMQSDEVGYGLTQIEETKLSWILLGWKVKVINRAKYNTEITIKTWARDSNKAFTYRDYEIYDENDNLIVIASSKWTLINIETKSLEKISEQLISKYCPESKCVFEDNKIDKLKEASNYKSEISYNILRNQIDVNEHVHNLCYLDFAYESLPEEVYKNETFDNIEIMYKKQIKYNDKIKCLYTKEDNKNIIVIKSEDEKALHAIINLY